MSFSRKTLLHGVCEMRKVKVKIRHAFRICFSKLPHRHVLVMGWVAGPVETTEVSTTAGLRGENTM